MSRIHVTALLALSVLALPTSTVFAQVIFGPGQAGVAGSSNPGGVQEKNVPICQSSGGGSRRKANCEPEPSAVRTEQEFKISIKAPELLNAQCVATATTDYQQRNTIARVNTTLKVDDCAAAAGEFTIALRVRDDSGETQSFEFPEMWQRSDDQDVKFTADYPIGVNVALVSARVRDLRCRCADTAATADAADTAAAADAADSTDAAKSATEN